MGSTDVRIADGETRPSRIEYVEIATNMQGAPLSPTLQYKGAIYDIHHETGGLFAVRRKPEEKSTQEPAHEPRNSRS